MGTTIPGSFGVATALFAASAFKTRVSAEGVGKVAEGALGGGDGFLGTMGCTGGDGLGTFGCP